MAKMMLRTEKMFGFLRSCKLSTTFDIVETRLNSSNIFTHPFAFACQGSILHPLKAFNLISSCFPIEGWRRHLSARKIQTSVVKYGMRSTEIDG
jgi:hypothetical protein